LYSKDKIDGAKVFEDLKLIIPLSTSKTSLFSDNLTSLSETLKSAFLNFSSDSIFSKLISAIDILLSILPIKLTLLESLIFFDSILSEKISA